jgi:abscisic acid receptor (PYR/PYL family)
MRGDLKVGCLREVRVVSGLPAATSTERLDILDDEKHILSFSIVGGDHRLSNYRSITSLHERLVSGKPGTIVIESYVVDVPSENTKEETCLFVDTIVKCNLQSLAHVSKHLIITPSCL